jgi:hypothetical protein
VVLKKLDEKRVILLQEGSEPGDDPRFAYKKAIIAAHKFLDEGGQGGLETLRKLYPGFKIVPSSILDDELLTQFKRAIFDSLGIIRVYTKKVGQEPDFTDPIILPEGGTVEDAAVELHKDFARKLQYAKIWGKGKFEGQKVKNNFVLSDEDIIEFRI